MLVLTASSSECHFVVVVCILVNSVLSMLKLLDLK